MMRSAADFLPLFMTTFMNLASMSLLNFGSGRIVRTGAGARRDIVCYPLLLRALGAVFRAALLALAHAGAIQRAADGVIPHAREVLDATATDEHYRVLLKIVAFTADIAGDLVAVRQAYAAHLPKSRIRLLRRRRIDARADAALLGGC